VKQKYSVYFHIVKAGGKSRAGLKQIHMQLHIQISKYRSEAVVQGAEHVYTE